MDTTEEYFFSIGVDSLSAMQIIHSIQSHFNVDITLQSFYENSTISSFHLFVQFIFYVFLIVCSANRLVTVDSSIDD